MNITLKKFTHNERLSEETYCFSATVCVDGVAKFEVANRGHGGSDEHYALPGSGPEGHQLMQKTVSEIEAYVATLPPEIVEGTELKKDMEWFIADLVTQALREKHKAKFAREMKTKVFLFENNQLFTLKIKKGVAMDARIFALASKKYPQAKILNSLPLDEAWNIAKPSLGFSTTE